MNKKQLYGQLLDYAQQISENSYSPYSKLKIGAVVLCEDNKVFCGTNVENVSYGLSMCAERVAIFTAIANGCKKIKAVAIYSGMTQHEIEVAVDNVTYGDYKFLYLSPERLKNYYFRERLKVMHVNLVVCAIFLIFAFSTS